MGGHGALICALKNPGKYRLGSAFAPICNPVLSPWGQGCFGAYLGRNRKAWEAYDATCLIETGAPLPPALIDHGTADEFLAEQLFPQNLQAACAARGHPADAAHAGPATTTATTSSPVSSASTWRFTRGRWCCPNAWGWTIRRSTS
jgi:S-formylglutathione hydrolase FrmB